MAYIYQHADPRESAGKNTDPQAGHGPVDKVFAPDPPGNQFVQIDEAVEGPGDEVSCW